MAKGKLIIGILLVLLIIAVAFIIFGRYSEVKQREQLNIYQQGIQLGYQQAILQIIQQAATCQQVPLFINNQTVNIVAVECLR